MSQVPPTAVAIIGAGLMGSQIGCEYALDVSPQLNKVRRGTSLVLRYAATRPGTVVVKLVRGTTLVRKKSSEVDAGTGTVRLSLKRLRVGHYKLRSKLEGVKGLPRPQNRRR